MFMTNIPRRKIYEEMLEFEDGLIEMQILTFSQKNFEKYHKKFNEGGFSKIKASYKNIKVLLVMFLENKKFELDGGFEEEHEKLLKDDMKINQYINSRKSLPNKFKKVLYRIDKEVIPLDKVEDLEQTKEVFDMLDKFNDFIPKILTIRRDSMKLE